jgi:hypothetical protein
LIFEGRLLEVKNGKKSHNRQFLITPLGEGKNDQSVKSTIFERWNLVVLTGICQNKNRVTHYKNG